jgi:hypothetical protein
LGKREYCRKASKSPTRELKRRLNRRYHPEQKAFEGQEILAQDDCRQTQEAHNRDTSDAAMLPMRPCASP